MPKLTRKLVDALAPKSTRYSVTDSSLPGFEIRVGLTGVKTASVYYFRNGRQRRVTLGKLGEAYPFARARADAVAILLAAKTGADPAAERTNERTVPTLEAVAKRHMEAARQRCKPASTTKFERLLRLYILPALGKMRVTEIRPSDVERMHGQLAGTPVVANASVRLLSAIMNRAEKWGYRPAHSNPCRGVDRYPESPRTRTLSAEERARLELALAEVESTGEMGAGIVAAVRLLSMTAARGAEIVGLTWDMVDLDRGVLQLVDSKTGPRAIPLSRQACDYLGRMHAERGSSPWVCPGPSGQLKNLRHAWLRLRLRAGLPDVKLHDLRRAAASDAAEAGVPIEVLRGVLGHASSRTTEIYVNPSLGAYREAARRMGDRIEEQTKAGAEKLREKK